MRRDVTCFDGGRGRRHGLSSPSHLRWPMLWLAVALGGALLLALVFAQMVRASAHTANLDSLVLTDVPLDFNADTEAYTATVLDAVNQTMVTATPAVMGHVVAITPTDADDCH